MLARRIRHDPILWHDGMMLSAQHFQQMSDRIEEMITYHTYLNSPYSWGVKKLRIEQELLAQGKFVISELEAVLPDGLVINKTINNNVHLELDLTSLYSAESKGMVDIYLFVPPKDKSTYSGNGDQHRFNQIKPEIIDDSSPYMEELKIPYLAPNISLIATNEVPDPSSSLRVAKLAIGNGLFRLDDYIPPMISISKECELWNIVSGIIQKLRIKSMFLARQISPSTIQNDPIILDKRLLLQCINISIPELEVLLNTPNISPFAIYLKLCSVVGSISALDYEMIPPSGFRYDHENLRNCFRQIKDWTYQVVDEAIGDNYHAIPFTKENNIFRLYIHSQWLKQSVIIGIQPKESYSENDILKWILNCIIGNEAYIIKARKERTLGAQRLQIDKDSTYPPTLDSLFFSIDPQSISPDKDLVILNPSDTGPETCVEKINLYVRRRTDI